MCGIAGIYGLESTDSRSALVKKMTDCMSHRGPDAEGIFYSDELALGHRRLSIIDLSPSANQPFTDKSGRWTVVFNGELFNFKEVKARIPDISFRTNGDTEVLAEALNLWGIEAIKQFNGMFSFAAWDNLEKKLFLVRDRLGVKPLYFHHNGKDLFFASELRAILATGMVKRKISIGSLQHYLYYQSIGGESTIIEEIKQLKPGCILEVSKMGINESEYWNITKPDVRFDFSDQKRTMLQIKEMFFRAVEQRLISDVPLGAFLSGGIDSSAVVAAMREVGQSRPVTFNVSFSEKEFDESAYARIIAEKFNTEHHEIKLNPNIFLDHLPEALDAIDSPTGDGINTFIVSKAVREAGLTVALSGVGGDELFAGYHYFNKYYKLNQLSPIWKHSYSFRKVISKILPGGKWKSILNVPSINIASVYPIFREVLSAEAIKGLLRDKREFIDPVELSLNSQIERINQFPVFSQLSIAEYLGYTQQTLLKDTDQMSMAVSLEVREPFFDHNLIEYVLQVPDQIKNPVYPKRLLVESLGGLLPESIVKRKKQGFTLPWKFWLRNELKSFGQQSINSLCDRSFVCPDVIQAQWRDFQNGNETNNWMNLWLLIQLEFWLSRNKIEE